MLKALLIALLEPVDTLARAEQRMDYTRRLMLFEEQKSMPWAAVWDYYCAQNTVPIGMAWFDEIKRYEAKVLSQRDAAVEAVR